jgi:hypothetical protein
MKIIRLYFILNLLILLGCYVHNSDKSNISKSVIVYHPNGNISSKYNTINDSIDGLKYDYYESGELLSVSTWRRNSLHGVFTEYYISGKTKSKEIYLNGKKNGICSYYNSVGKIENIKEYIVISKNNGYRFFFKENEQPYDVEVLNRYIYIKDSIIEDSSFAFEIHRSKDKDGTRLLNFKNISPYENNVRAILLDRYNQLDTFIINGKNIIVIEPVKKNYVFALIECDFFQDDGSKNVRMLFIEIGDSELFKRAFQEIR